MPSVVMRSGTFSGGLNGKEAIGAAVGDLARLVEHRRAELDVRRRADGVRAGQIACALRW